MGRSVSDGRQADIFGITEPATPAPRPTRRRRAEEAPALPAPAVPPPPAPPRAPPHSPDASTDVLAARLTPSELEELAASLSDDNLAHLVLASIRQLRLRLGRAERRGGKGRPSPLERANRQLATELAREIAED